MKTDGGQTASLRACNRAGPAWRRHCWAAALAKAANRTIEPAFRIVTEDSNVKAWRNTNLTR
jgi:hypothetical protein